VDEAPALQAAENDGHLNGIHGPPQVIPKTLRREESAQKIEMRETRRALFEAWRGFFAAGQAFFTAIPTLPVPPSR
jgi:hypothetical protein